MPKHIRAKIKTGPLSLETCSAFLSNLFNLKKINSPDALPPSHRRLLLGDYITGRRGVICDLDCSLYPCTTHRLCFYIVESSKPSFDRVMLSVPSPPPPQYLFMTRPNPPTDGTRSMGGYVRTMIVPPFPQTLFEPNASPGNPETQCSKISTQTIRVPTSTIRWGKSSLFKICNIQKPA